MDDIDEKVDFLIYLIFGVNEYVWVKVNSMLWIGKLGELIVEFIFFGWIMMFFGKEVDLIDMFLM